jgi:hypothetical protein
MGGQTLAIDYQISGILGERPLIAGKLTPGLFNRVSIRVNMT